ncbi:MAG: PA2778 family cysteine peptidase [Gammaproteobacteria bacterium]|nr:PA2778 family cysteine peptidase [Gammaproteobacteria bacterium]
MRALKPGYRCLAGLFFIFLISACTTPKQSIGLRESSPDIPVFAELTSTPFYPQREYQCGPAALATVINFSETVITPDLLIPQVFIPKLKGTLQMEMLAASRRLNRMAIEQDGKLESILKEVANGTPVLVMQNLGLKSYPFWHYAVVVGYDLDKQEIILRSGEIKRLVRSFSVFERTWQRSKFWSVVIVPPGVLPVTASAEKYSTAAIAFELSSTLKLSLLVYQKGIQRWPDNFLLQMGFGNISYALQNYAAAETAFTTAATIKPLKAEAWNNLAYALVKQGKKKMSLNAVNKAIKIDPENEKFRNSLDEIKNM